MSSKPTRNKALLALLIGTGIRRAECCSIDIEHIELFDDKPGGRILIPRGKADKQRTVIFDDSTRYYIDKHLDFLTEGGKTTGPFFYGLSLNDRLLPQSLTVIINKIVKQAELEQMIHGPHDFRRMFATYWSRNQRGMDSPNH